MGLFCNLNLMISRYCPLGRGVISGAVTSYEDIPEKDYRRMLPRYQPENLKKNRLLVEQIEELAEQKGVTTAQMSLAWLLGLSRRRGMPIIILIPGSGVLFLHIASLSHDF